MSKHTEGPWKVQYISGICIGVAAPDENTPGYSTVIVNTILPETDDDYDKEREQIEANARLIAAAPTMYDLLSDIVAFNGTKDDFDWDQVHQLLNRINSNPNDPTNPH